MSLQVKAAVRLRDGMRCIDCDLTNEQHVEQYGRQLEVHRVSPGSPYTLDGCVTVCRPCHRKRHRKRPTATVRLKGDLMEQARTTCLLSRRHLVDYLDELLREAVTRDYKAAKKRFIEGDESRGI